MNDKVYVKIRGLSAQEAGDAYTLGGQARNIYAMKKSMMEKVQNLTRLLKYQRTELR